MCDTQIIKTRQTTFFAKNSDREPNEPQSVVRIPPVDNGAAKTVNLTYLSIPQVARRHGLIISKPSWTWGAEMGVNDHGLVIGNQAVFTKLVEREDHALLGMDLVRLGLERSSCADEALATITRLLDAHGQGGPAGFSDKKFAYDNSFIIADEKKIWLLETAGRWWAAKKVNRLEALSNALTIQDDFDLAKAGIEDFARQSGLVNRFQKFSFSRAFSQFWMPKFASAKARRQLSLRHLNSLDAEQTAPLPNMINILRQHHQEKRDFSLHSNRDICMHAACAARPHQTNASMVVKLEPHEAPEVLVTGTAAPCLSLFKPVHFEYDHPLVTDDTVTPSTKKQPCTLWERFEPVHRKALFDETFRYRLIESRNITETRILACQQGGVINVEASDQLAREWHKEWEKQARHYTPEYSRFRAYDRFWSRLDSQVHGDSD